MEAAKRHFLVLKIHFSPNFKERSLFKEYLFSFSRTNRAPESGESGTFSLKKSIFIQNGYLLASKKALSNLQKAFSAGFRYKRDYFLDKNH